MNGLKSIKDTHGHKTGNTFIKAYSYRIKKAFRKNGKIFRTCGNEFTVSIINPVQSITDHCLIDLKNLQMDAGKYSALHPSSSYGIACREKIQ